MNDENRCPGTNRNGEPCGHPQGWGVEGKSEGPCKFHGGAGGSGGPREGSGAPEENTNAVTHGMHVEDHAWYSDIASDAERRIVDNVLASYFERYRSAYGEPDSGDKWELFFCAVTIGKEIHGENWAAEKPKSLESGNSLIDKETKYTQDGEQYHEYKPTVVQKAANALSNRRRMWLKDLGLLEDPQSQTADSVANLADLWEADLTD